MLVKQMLVKINIIRIRETTLSFHNHVTEYSVTKYINKQLIYSFRDPLILF